MKAVGSGFVGGLMAMAAVAAGAGTSAGSAVAADATSTYTKINLEECSIFRQDAESASMSWFCPALPGEALYVAEGDLRFFVSHGPAAEAQVAASQTLPMFNRINDTLEWRLGPDGRAFATILRWFTEFDDGRVGQVLVVTRIADDGVCHVAYVDALANPNANALARQAADTLSAGFNCETQRPVIVGTPGWSLGN